jgi:caa(3)-type oxidase subunit IV
MSTEQAAHADHSAHPDGGHDHPADRTYWMVGLFLAVLTALEVSTIWWKEGAVTTAALLVMMVIKFAVVGGFFMHLKFDSKVLRRIFMGGIVMALGVYFGALGSLTFFENSGNNRLIDPPRSKPLPPPPTDPPPSIVKPAGH